MELIVEYPKNTILKPVFLNLCKREIMLMTFVSILLAITLINVCGNPPVHDQFYDSPTTNYQQKKQIRSPRSLKTLVYYFFIIKLIG